MTCRVLVVDDEPRVGQMLEKTLPKHGFSVAWTADPVEALELLRDEDFELLVADFRMPGLDGASLCRRAMELRSDLRDVVITAF
ncbi:MAG: response regulator, partial [Polyangiaceae bacterium]|nr:response regulator [Polyangiaceae bacterium]